MAETKHPEYLWFVSSWTRTHRKSRYRVTFGMYLGVSDLSLTEIWDASISSEHVEIEESHLVSPSEPGFAEYSIEVPEDTDPGHYQGNLAGYISDGEASVVDDMNLDVLQPATFDVKIDRNETQEFVVEGETLEVLADITNIGDVEGVQEIPLQGSDNDTRDTRVVSLEPDDTENVVLELDTDDEVGEAEVTVKSEDRRDSMDVEIGEPAEFEVRSLNTTEPVSPGDTLEVQAEFENTGDIETTQEVELLDFEKAVVHSTSLSLDAGEQGEVVFEWQPDEDDIGRDTVSVRSEDSESTTEVLVGEPAYYTVDVDEENTDEAVADGETLEVHTSVENEGDIEGEQQVELLDFEGVTVDSETLTLASGEGEEIVLEWQTGEDDIGRDNISMKTENTSDSLEVIVGEPPYFAAEIQEDQTNDTVSDGDNLDVVTSVENTGDVQGTQEIELLNFDDEAVDSAAVSLDAGETRKVSLEWQTKEDDIGRDNVSVRSEDTQDSTEVLVGEPPHYTVEIGDNHTKDNVSKNETLEVHASVENEGDVEDVQDVELLDFHEEKVDSTTLTLDAGEVKRVVLEWTPDDSDVGVDNISVRSDDTRDVTEVLVGDPAFYYVKILENETDQQVGDGEVLELNASVENQGDVESAQEVSLLDFDGDIADSKTATLVPGDQREITFEWQPDEDDIGRDNLSVHSDDSNDSIEVLVGEPPHFDVNIDENKTRDNVSEGEALEVYASVENEGDVHGTDDIELLDFTGEAVDSTTVSLNASERTETMLEWETTEDDVGRDNISVRSNDTQDSTEVLVGEQAFYDVEIYENKSDDNVAAGKALDVYVSVENQGDVEGIQQIELLDIDGETADSAELSIEPGERQEVRLQWETTEDDVGTGDITVHSDDATASIEAVVDDTTEFELEDVDATEPRMTDSTIDVEFTVANTGDTNGEQQVELIDEDGDTVDSTVVTLEANETQPVTLQWTADKVEEHHLKVETEDDAETTLVRIEKAEANVLRTAVNSIPEDGYRYHWWSEFHRSLLLHQIHTFETLKENHGNHWLAKLYLEHRIKPSIQKWIKEDYEAEDEGELTKQEVQETIDHIIIAPNEKL